MVPGHAGDEPLGWYIGDAGSGMIYKQGRLLGKGTFGRCYEVTEVSSGRLYALKVIPRARLAALGGGERVEREQELHRHLSHRHIVRLHRHFSDRGHLCLLLELCSRGSLADILRARGRLQEPEVRFYLRQVISGLRYLHGRGLVHRDLKLSNFLVTGKMQVKIGDLGLARGVAPAGRRWGALCGTPSYLAPEVLDRRGHGVASDIWALGCALYTALTGRPPFEGSQRLELYQHIRGARYPLPPQLSPRARALLALMLDPDPTARPSLQDVLDHPFFTQGFTPHRLPPRACHSMPLFLGQDPLCRLLQHCWGGGWAPGTPGGAVSPPTQRSSSLDRTQARQTSAEENLY
ncbi:inactive serine/threonine-protein kinase PLK5-like [Empidonax traillii]|uniref:inactive serine/threonine-protein kinase PLK5-like n=1 Tax=Empidonax traillii TaxID=164674 RepID=UPI000FFD1D57|nr:inactive serine/threonine-protein kinase PLK5-like [Empidonax traillii]